MHHMGYIGASNIVPSVLDHDIILNCLDILERIGREGRANGILHAEMAHKGTTHAQLIGLFEANGIKDKKRNLRNKISRGKFTAGFILQHLPAIGCTSLQL